MVPAVAPLLIGCDMTKLDDFTLNLLSNDEVLAVDQDALGQQATRMVPRTGNWKSGPRTWRTVPKTVGLFNRGEVKTTMTLRWADLGLTGRQTVRDLWRQKDLGVFDQQFQVQVDRHGVALLKLMPAE